MERGILKIIIITNKENFLLVMRNWVSGQAGFREVLRQIPEGNEAGPDRRAPGAAGQERTRRGAGDRRGAQAQSRPVRHLGPGPALRPQFRSPPPPAATRPRRGPASRKSRPTTERSPRPPTPVLTIRSPTPRPGVSGARGRPEGEGSGWDGCARSSRRR